MKIAKLALRTFAFAVPLVVSASTFALEGPGIRTYFGGYGHSVYETPDGGAILGGTFGAGFDCCRPWLIKLNPDGTVLWHRTYDSPGLAGANNIVPTRDGGWVLSGEGIEFMVVKLDADGNVQWARSYGDGGYTKLRVLESAEGNILLTGATQLEDGITTNGRAILLDPEGEVLWQKVYGRPAVTEYFSEATVGYNGNFIVAGSSRGEYWILELDRDTGSIVWERLYGGNFEDTGLLVTKALKRYVVVGSSETYSDGGLRNWWVLILTPSGNIWREFSLGGFDAEDPLTTIATSDGGFLIGGGTGSFGAGFSDIWLVKFDSHARIEWQKTYGREFRTDHAWHVQETPTGYTVIGDSYAAPFEYEVWLMSIDRQGNVESGECGVVGDTKVELGRTSTSQKPTGSMAIDTKFRPLELDVIVTEQPFPIEACPAPTRAP